MWPRATRMWGLVAPCQALMIFSIPGVSADAVCNRSFCGRFGIVASGVTWATEPRVLVQVDSECSWAWGPAKLSPLHRYGLLLFRYLSKQSAVSDHQWANKSGPRIFM